MFASVLFFWEGTTPKMLDMLFIGNVPRRAAFGSFVSPPKEMPCCFLWMSKKNGYALRLIDPSENPLLSNAKCECPHVVPLLRRPLTQNKRLLQSLLTSRSRSSGRPGAGPGGRRPTPRGARVPLSAARTPRRARRWPRAPHASPRRGKLRRRQVSFAPSLVSWQLELWTALFDKLK